MGYVQWGRAPRALMSTVIAAALFVTNAQAAVLTNVIGVVFVNRGDGFRPAMVGSSLISGDRVRVDNGSADIVYENGCSTKVGPQQVSLVLSAPPPCNGGLKDGGTAAASEPSIDPLLAGGLVGGSALGLALVISSNNGNSNGSAFKRSVSP